MTTWWLIFILGTLTAVFFGFIWIVVTLSRLGGGGKVGGKRSTEDLNKSYSDIVEEDATHLFNKEFREELRNRGRLRFEKIIDENAMFLKQDLDMTIAQLNEYMKKQISSKLEQEFAAYSKAMGEAQELAIDSLKKTATDVEQQRNAMVDAMQKEVTARETAMIDVYQENMAKIIEHYLQSSLGETIDLNSQLPYIIARMEENKKDMVEDMRL